MENEKLPIGTRVRYVGDDENHGEVQLIPPRGVLGTIDNYDDGAYDYYVKWDEQVWGEISWYYYADVIAPVVNGEF